MTDQASPRRVNGELWAVRLEDGTHAQTPCGQVLLRASKREAQQIADDFNARSKESDDG